MASCSRSSSDRPARTPISSIAGERRWRASKQAGLDTIPALIEDIDDDTALEISIIENLQREDISPLDEAAMYDRMVTEHGYSIRKLADKLGKDKGYVENRLRLADAPDEVRELVSLRKDTLSHAYELMKVEDPKRRRRLADQVARGELTLDQAPRQDRGTPATRPATLDEVNGSSRPSISTPTTEPRRRRVEQPTRSRWRRNRPSRSKSRRDRSRPTSARTRWSTPSRHSPKRSTNWSNVLRAPDAIRSIPDVDRDNLAKYLTISKLRLENAIALVRSGDGFD